MKNIIKKADIVLFILLALIGLGLSYLSATSGTAGQKVLVTVDGQVYGTYSLAQDQTIEIKQKNHLNKITIKDGTVQMSSSDCKNQVCVKDGAIHLTHQSLVCLPNKVMVEVVGGEEEIDAIAK
ncbi:hypothetical protein M2140_001065 [Clostridiales Family XIII bacterium PM5-7]